MTHLQQQWRRRIEASEDYRGLHQPPEDGPPLHDLLAEGSWLPDDVYAHPEFYCYGDPLVDSESIAVVRAIRGKADQRVTIYRAAPAGLSTINHGDWVALSIAYCRQHAMDATDPSKDWPVYSAVVPAHTVRNGGNDLIEWGYWGPAVSAHVV